MSFFMEVSIMKNCYDILVTFGQSNSNIKIMTALSSILKLICSGGFKHIKRILGKPELMGNFTIIQQMEQL